MTAQQNNKLIHTDYTLIIDKLNKYNLYYNSLIEDPDNNKGSVWFNTSGSNRRRYDYHVATRNWDYNYRQPIAQEDRKKKYFGTNPYDYSALPNENTTVKAKSTNNNPLHTSTNNKTHQFFKTALANLFHGVVNNLVNTEYSEKFVMPSLTNYNNAQGEGDRDTEALSNHINDIENALDDLYNAFENQAGGFYDSDEYCSRSCQTNCQSTCQISCQNWCTNCHNQHCGLA